MSITVIYNRKESKHSFSITKSTFIFACITLVAVLMTSAWLLQSHYHQQFIQYKINALHEKNEIKQQYLESIASQTNQQLQSLAEKVGELQAQSNRLNSLGERIIDKSNLPKEEFELDTQTEQTTETDDNLAAPDTSSVPPLDNDELLPLLKKVSLLEEQYKNNENLFQQLEITFNNLHLIDELFISGRPVPYKGSWISSPFGTRTDPFTGRLSRHKGVDIAGYSGMPIMATAAGVVTISEARNGYGYLVEINHGSGLMTRYAHASAITVSVGDVVEKGQQVAVMGTTGRSTGPHVHYEVLRNGQQIDPNYYIQRTPS
ncbi:M23 family metallopeptidase [Psychromonas sp. 14N.309.X.WAT.B.A12]|uniref:M23 family metallopeptidase n=1 Tax=unclassified Psychromonas TaxID=2614957 RepID=UPI0025AFC00A|nr:M23 family metallopeptidase [Psychromonas sp. 14N.309.X.WAT.B.A12]MDN2663658.1 M23 family metallopeptidase [Psychromonas sp. 14N.309.X.WAT.B.A12]